jgi:hypothetical protein
MVIVHLDDLFEIQGAPKGLFIDLKCDLYVLFTKLMVDLLSALTSKTHIKHSAAEDGLSLSLIDGFLANMG